MGQLWRPRSLRLCPHMSAGKQLAAGLAVTYSEMGSTIENTTRGTVGSNEAIVL